MFFLYWLVWRIKMEAITIQDLQDPRVYRLPGSLTRRDFLEKYKKAPYIRRIREIIDSLYKDFEELEFLNDNVISLYKTRFESDHFVKFVESLQRTRDNAFYNDPKKKKEVWTTWFGPKFVKRVGLFIHAQPEKQITRRALLRHFSNKREKDLSDILGLLESNFRIYAENRGKSIVYRVE